MEILVRFLIETNLKNKYDGDQFISNFIVTYFDHTPHRKIIQLSNIIVLFALSFWEDDMINIGIVLKCFRIGIDL